MASGTANSSHLNHDQPTDRRKGLYVACGSRAIRVHHQDSGEGWQQAAMVTGAGSQDLKAHISNHKQEAERVNRGWWRLLKHKAPPPQ